MDEGELTELPEASLRGRERIHMEPREQGGRSQGGGDVRGSSGVKRSHRFDDGRRGRLTRGHRI